MLGPSLTPSGRHVLAKSGHLVFYLLILTPDMQLSGWGATAGDWLSSGHAKSAWISEREAGKISHEAWISYNVLILWDDCTMSDFRVRTRARSLLLLQKQQLAPAHIENTESNLSIVSVKKKTLSIVNELKLKPQQKKVCKRLLLPVIWSFRASKYCKRTSTF